MLLRIASSNVQVIETIPSDHTCWSMRTGLPSGSIIQVGRTGDMTRAHGDSQSDSAPGCRGQMPEELLTRRYRVAITQIAGRLTAQVSRATLAVGSKVFGGWAEPERVVLDFQYDPYSGYGPDVVEIVDEQTYLVFWGLSPLTPSGRGFTGWFIGSILIYERDLSTRPTTTKSWCHAGNTRVTLDRL
jgi:hypothetical protein